MKKNFHDFKAKSKNQLIAAIYHLELNNIDTQYIEVEDWEEVTLRLSLSYQLSGAFSDLTEISVSPVYKNEKSYQTLNLNKGYIEEMNFERFVHIVSLSKKIKETV